MFGTENGFVDGRAEIAVETIGVGRIAEEETERPVADKEASAPCSLAPVAHLGAHQQESWQHSSFGSQHQHHDNQNLLVSGLLFNVSRGKLYSYYIFCILGNGSQGKG